MQKEISGTKQMHKEYVKSQKQIASKKRFAEIFVFRGILQIILPRKSNTRENHTKIYYIYAWMIYAPHIFDGK